MFRQKLFKRVMPMVLGISMMFQSVPVTALAAEADVSVEQAAVSETEAEEATAPEVEGQEDESEEATVPETEGQEAESEEAAAPETEGQEVVSEETTAPETSDEEAEVINEEVVPDAAAEILAEEGTEVGQAKITLNKEAIANALAYYYQSYYKYDMISEIILADYHNSQGVNFTAEMKALLNYASALRVDGAETDELKYTWQKKSGENYANMGADQQPSGVGSYRLVISLDAVEGVHTAAESVSVDMDIRRTLLTVVNWELYFSAGTSVADVKKANEDAGVYLSTGEDTLDRATSIQAVSFKVRNADENKEIGDTDLLKLGVNYSIIADVTLTDGVKDSYEVTENAANIIVDGLVPAEIIYTPVTAPAEDEEFVIVKTYDGKPIDAETEVKNKYTVKVVYGEGTEQKEIADAKVEAAWHEAEEGWYEWDISDEEMDAAPTDAGYYVYRLTYTDEENVYSAFPVDIPVQIKPADLVIKPKFSKADEKYYSGVSIKEVLKNVAYDVYKTTDNGTLSETPEKVDEYYWGVYSGNVGYEPVFAVERGVKDEAGNIDWSTYGYSSTLGYQDNVVYRLIFKGEKGIYNGGTLSYSDDINSGMLNYQVDVTEETNSKYAIEINLAPGEEAEIKVDALLTDGKGAELGKPIVKTYENGKALFDSIGDYKKATVSVKGTATPVTGGELTYQWQYTDEYIELDEEGKAYLDDEYWGDYNFNNIEVGVSPSTKGVYRLVVTYEDESNQYYAAPAYVYYTIKPQDVVLSLSGEPVAYTSGEEYGDNTIGRFLSDLQNKTEEVAATYVKVEAYPATVAEDVAGKVTVTKGEKAIEDFRLYETYLYVEKKVSTDGVDSWVWCEGDDYFVAGTEYRLNVGYYDDDGYNYFRYNVGQKLDDYGQFVADNYYENEPVSITLAEGKEIDVTVSTALESKTKPYDGKPFDFTTDSVKSDIVIKDKGTGDIITNQFQYSCYLIDKAAEGDYFDTIENTIHVGEYTLYVYVEGNGTYRGGSFDCAKFLTFKIEPKEITITPTLKEKISAGEIIRYAGDVEKYILDSYKVSDDVNDINSISWSVYKRDDKTYSGVLKSTEEYYLDCDVEFAWYVDEYGDEYSYEDDYVVKSEKVVFTPERAAGTLEEGNTGISDKAEWKDNLNRFVHTVNTTDAIPYDYDEEQNIFRVRLNAPKEFSCGYYDFDFTSIENIFRDNKIGTITNEYYEWVYTDYNDYTQYYCPYVEIELDATDQSKKDFTIFWAADYTEEYVFDFSASLLQANFTKAVEPKSIAFNKPSTKMAVGDVQQLDVKLTKLQMNDVIYLGYKSDHDEILHVTESGHLTALSVGTATIEVYPCVAVKNSKGGYDKTPIPGAKVATVKITVSEVAAPKINGITQVGNDELVIKYKKPDNGYRREVYLLSGKKTVKDFEDEIVNVKKGDYSKFAYMGYLDYSDGSGDYDCDKKGVVTVDRTVGELTPSTDYTVYVRNVSRVRTVSGGSKVVLSHAGEVKTFKVTKPQLIGLDLYFDLDAKGQTVKCDYEGDWYAELKDKSAKLSVNAKFDAKYFDTNANTGNYVWRPLPLAGNDKSTLEAPMLDYFVDAYDSVKDEWVWAKSNDIASIDKSGKITFKGKGWVEIYVIDTKSGCDDTIDLYIDASPNSITGKKVKVLPGDGFLLSSCLEYKQDQIKLSGYSERVDLSINAVSNDSFNIEPYTESEYGRDYWITALKPGATLNLQVKDRTVTANGGGAATVQITSAAVEPVKNLKADRVYDKLFRVTFTYPMSSYYFKVELTDSRNAVIYSKVESLEYDKYDSKRKVYEYQMTFGAKELLDTEYNIIRDIEMLSDYNLTVTALCNGEPSKKDAKLKIKTTNIPASYNDVDDWYYDEYGNDIEGDFYGNSTIRVNNAKSSATLGDNAVLVSGNSYTLELPLRGYNDNYSSRLRKTDTLTWKIKVDKENGDTAGVATLKANAGSYTATLKTLQPGWTTIEVSSKLTKKVIARYQVYVNAVGDANNGRYYGDNEPR